MVGPDPPVATTTACDRPSVQGVDDAPGIVVDRGGFEDLETEGRELGREPIGVGVDDFTARQLGADRENGRESWGRRGYHGARIAVPGGAAKPGAGGAGNRGP